jgi:hypothetical protein
MREAAVENQLIGADFEDWLLTRGPVQNSLVCKFDIFFCCLFFLLAITRVYRTNDLARSKLCSSTLNRGPSWPVKSLIHFAIEPVQLIRIPFRVLIPALLRNIPFCFLEGRIRLNSVSISFTRHHRSMKVAYSFEILTSLGTA